MIKHKNPRWLSRNFYALYEIYSDPSMTDLSASCKFCDLAHQRVNVHAVNHRGFLQGLSLCGRTAQAVHASIHEHRRHLRLCAQDLADRHILRYLCHCRFLLLCHSFSMTLLVLLCLEYGNIFVVTNHYYNIFWEFNQVFLKSMPRLSTEKGF